MILVEPEHPKIHYLCPCALHGFLRDTVDLLVHIHFLFLFTSKSHQKNSKAGAPKVQSQEITLL